MSIESIRDVDELVEELDCSSIGYNGNAELWSWLCEACALPSDDREYAIRRFQLYLIDMLNATAYALEHNGELPKVHHYPML